MSKSAEYFFKGLKFDADRYMESHDLNEAHSILIGVEFINFLTPDFSFPVINPTCQSYFEEFLKSKLNSRELSELERISEEFKKEMDVRGIFD